MDRVAIGGDGRQLNRTVLVFHFEGFADTASAALRRLAPGLASVIHPERHVTDTVAMAMDVVGNLTGRAQRRREHKTDLALLQHIRRAVALTGLRTGVGHQAHAERDAVEVCSLAGIANVELDVIGAIKG